MINMFGRDYEEIGSSSKGLILKNSGKIKVLWGRKFIDLLDSEGNLNIGLRTLIKEVSSEKGINKDGFYFFKNNLIAKVGNNIIELSPNLGEVYVSFLEEQNASSESKYTALKNIGFIYPEINDNNIYPTNGIIYVEEDRALFIVKDGVLSRYTADIPNPYIKLFIISKEDSKIGALIITGDGEQNSLVFDTLKIYSKDGYSIAEFNKEFSFNKGNKKVLNIKLTGIETNGIQSFGANSLNGYRIYVDNGKYVLDIDRINVRDGIDYYKEYFDNNIYTKRFVISYFNMVGLNNNNSDNIDYFIFNTNTNDVSILNDSLIEIPIKVVKCTINTGSAGGLSVSYFSPSNNTTHKEYNSRDEIEVITQPKELLYVFRFVLNKVSGYDVLRLINEDNAVIHPTFKRYKYLDAESFEFRDSLTFLEKINNQTVTSTYVFPEKRLTKSFEDLSLYVISEPNTDTRIRYNFKNAEITLLQNDRRSTKLTNYDQIIHEKIGNIKEFKTYKTVNDAVNNANDPNHQGLFSDSNVFVGGEFRQPIPTKKKELVEGTSDEYVIKDVPEKIKYYHYPRYSIDLNKGITLDLKFLETHASDILNDANYLDSNGVSFLNILSKDEVILPKKWIPRTANYIEDLQSSSTRVLDSTNALYTLETNDEFLYEGKLFLFRVLYATDNKLQIRFKLKPIEEDQHGNPVIRYTNYYNVYNTHVPGNSLIQMTENNCGYDITALLLYSDGKIYTTLIANRLEVGHKEGNGQSYYFGYSLPLFDTICFWDDRNIVFEVLLENNKMMIRGDIGPVLEQRLTNIENRLPAL